MTKEQVDLLIDTAGNEVLGFLIETPKKTYWGEENSEVFELWRIFIEGGEDNE